MKAVIYDDLEHTITTNRKSFDAYLLSSNQNVQAKLIRTNEMLWKD